MKGAIARAGVSLDQPLDLLLASPFITPKPGTGKSPFNAEINPQNDAAGLFPQQNDQGQAA
jgi:hypothetical protein